MSVLALMIVAAIFSILAAGTGIGVLMLSVTQLGKAAPTPALAAI